MFQANFGSTVLYLSFNNPYRIGDDKTNKLVIKLSKELPKPFKSLLRELIIYPDKVGKKAEAEKKYPKTNTINLLNCIATLTKTINRTLRVPKNITTHIDFFDSYPPKNLLHIAPTINPPSDGAAIVVML